MKKALLISGYVVLVCLSIIFGLSMVEVNMTQHQQQTQQQIQRNDNVQLTIVDTSRKIENIYWVATNFTKTKDLEIFLNTELNFFQVRESKISYRYFNGLRSEEFLVVYPTTRKEVEVHTNFQKQSQTQTNYFKFNAFDKVVP